MAANGLVEREETISYFGDLLSSKLEREPAMIWDDLVAAAADIAAARLLPEVERAYAENLADPGMATLAELTRDIGRDPFDAMAALRSQNELVDDTAEAVAWWAGRWP